jgi:hypothetical protein
MGATRADQRRNTRMLRRVAPPGLLRLAAMITLGLSLLLFRV